MLSIRLRRSSFVSFFFFLRLLLSFALKAILPALSFHRFLSGQVWCFGVCPLTLQFEPIRHHQTLFLNLPIFGHITAFIVVIGSQIGQICSLGEI